MRHVLEIAGKRPPENFIVYWLSKEHVLESLGLDRTVHVHRHGVASFFTFEVTDPIDLR